MWINIIGKAYYQIFYKIHQLTFTIALNMIKICSKNIESLITNDEYSEIKTDVIVLCEKFDGAPSFDEQQNKKNC